MTKPAEILKLEKFYNITLSEKHYRLNENNQIIFLDLSDNNISNIEILKDFKSLIELDLTDNAISNIEVLKELESLKKLELGFNLISNIEVLKELKSLIELGLWANQISNIEVLKELKLLKELFLSGNKISNIEALKELKSLRELFLSNNKISNIEALKELKSLETLYLHSNQISNIEALKDLKSLSILHLYSNKICNINDVKSLLDNSLNLEVISIYKNPFLEDIDLTLELTIGANNLIDLKNYFSKEDENNKIEVLLPAKIMLLGNHSSGKSTFLSNYFKENNQDKSSTHILDIRHYKKSKEANILPEAIFFDFGGQDYYHGVYKAFMTNDSTNLVFWQQDTDNNKIGIDKSGRNNHTQNFNRNYWIK